MVSERSTHQIIGGLVFVYGVEETAGRWFESQCGRWMIFLWFGAKGLNDGWYLD
jgi:hypothetical protein